jgi:hypothetical protein
MTDFEFLEKISNTMPDGVIEYHRGFLFNDAWASGTGKMSESSEMKRIRDLRDVAFDMWERGLVHLLQERCGDYDYRYLAIVRPLRRQRKRSTI